MEDLNAELLRFAENNGNCALNRSLEVTRLGKLF